MVEQKSIYFSFRYLFYTKIGLFYVFTLHCLIYYSISKKGNNKIEPEELKALVKDQEQFGGGNDNTLSKPLTVLKEQSLVWLNKAERIIKIILEWNENFREIWLKKGHFKISFFTHNAGARLNRIDNHFL